MSQISGYIDRMKNLLFLQSSCDSYKASCDAGNANSCIH